MESKHVSDLNHSPPKKDLPIGRDSSGIALFMVIASISVLAILVTEFTYIAQVSQMIAFGGLDQAKAHYLAKSGLKISLLRLKAYQQVKTLVGSMGGAAGASVVPKSLIQKIWNFPFFYPIPTNIPGMTGFEKEAIEKFQKESSLEGKFSALIESESSKYNLNSILSNYAASPTPGGSPPLTGASSSPNQPLASASFNPDVARESLGTFLNQIWLRKLELDPDFASSYRDLRMEDLLTGIVSWADRTYDRRVSSNLERFPPKKEPFYSLTELHMVPLIDDELYKLFAPSLTVSTTDGVNINTMQEMTLRALVPNMTKEEAAEFFKFRDSEESDNQFKSADDFYGYLTKFVNAYRGNQQAVDQLKTDLASRNIFLITDETEFKITVQAQVNTATRKIEAWVTLGTGSPNPTSSSTPPPPAQGGVITTPPPADSGLKITYMRIS
jgi:type II secretory pathway component PulK